MAETKTSKTQPESERRTTPNGKVSRRHSRVRWLLRQVEHCLALLGLATVVYYSCFHLSRIASDSMAPTLQGDDWRSGDLVLTERVSYWLRHPCRWEVITFRRSDGTQVMKRVIGLPGERVQMLRGGRILIDGEEIERPAELENLYYFPYGNLTSGETVACGNACFVLGDKSKDSDDSRFNGPVPLDDVMGRAWLILAPSSRRGMINP